MTSLAHLQLNDGIVRMLHHHENELGAHVVVTALAATCTNTRHKNVINIAVLPMYVS